MTQDERVFPGPVEVPAQVHDPARLAAVYATGLLGTPPEPTFDDLAGLAAAMTGVPWAFVTIVDEHRSYWKSAIGLGELDIAQRQGPVGESFCKYLIATGGPVVLDDVRADSRVRDNPTVEALGIGAWAGYPIRGPHDEVLGSFCVIDAQPRHWTDGELRTLATLARAVSGEIGLRLALHQTRELADQLEQAGQVATNLARNLQQSLLPPVLPDIAGVDVAAAYLAAGTAEVLGDFYDLFEHRPGRWSAVLGDVAGKGVEAAKVTALARYTVRAEATQAGGPLPATVLHRLNEALLAQQGAEGRMLSSILLSFTVVDAGLSGHLCTAGHPPALLRRADGTVAAIGASGMVLGIVPDPPLHNVALIMGPGDLLLLYTDGITEARPSRTSDLFGQQRLEAALAGADGLDASATIQLVADAATGYAAGNGRDDTALLAIRIPPVSLRGVGGHLVCSSEVWRGSATVWP